VDHDKPITHLELVTQFLLQHTRISDHLSITYQSFIDHIAHGMAPENYFRLACISPPTERTFGAFLGNYMRAHGKELVKTRVSRNRQKVLIYHGIGLK
jgi:hypothetical protein